MTKKNVVILIVVSLIMVAVLVACNAGTPQPAQAPAAPAQMDGASLLEARCSKCHSADRPKQAQKTPDQWNQTVTRMMGKGAELTEAEKIVLVDYLAKTYKP
jgi:cytochrome c553